MAKRKRLNIVYANRNTKSHVQPQEQKPMPPQHEQQSPEQLPSGSVQKPLENNTGPETQPSDNIPSKKVKGSNEKGHVHCMGMIATSSFDRSGPSHSQMHQNKDLEELTAEIRGLREALMIVLSVLQKQFPNENVNDLINATRTANREVPDDNDDNKQSSISSNQPNQNENGNDAP